MTYPAFVVTAEDEAAYEVARAGGWEEWVRHAADLRAIENGCHFSLDHALYVRNFFEKLLCVAPGKPFILLDWQWRDVIGPIFGWRNRHGKRRFREAYIEIPKGNGKSLLCSGIALYMLVGDGRYGSETFCAAADKSQAETVFKEAAKFVSMCPSLRKRLQIVNSQKRIILKDKRGMPVNIMRALSKDSGNSQGLKGHCLVADELHVWKDRELFGSLRYATTKIDFAQDHDTPLFISITTAGSDRKSIGWDEHEKARKYLEGIVGNNGEYQDYYAVIYAISEGDDVYDEANWYKCNPSLGKSLNIEEMRSAAQKAKDSKSEELMWRRYRCNQWTSGQINGWLPMKSWFKCKPRLSHNDLLGRECWAGLDLSSTKDLTCLSLAFPDGEGGYHVLPYIWCPEDTVIERTQRENIPYHQWKELGLIETTPGDAVDYDYIRQRIKEISDLYQIKDIGLDRNWQGQALMTDLVADGHNVVPFAQNMQAMSNPSKLFEILVLKSLIRHGDNPVMQWSASNCVAVTDFNENCKVDKKKSTEKVDPIVATIIAIGRHVASDGEQLDPNLIYESRGLLII